MFIDVAFLSDTFLKLCAALPVTLGLFICSFLCGGVLAVGVLALRMSRWPLLSGFAKGYILVFRGSPLLIQLFLIYYGLGQFGVIRHSFLWPLLREPFICAVLALALCTAAYTAEILRGALLAVPSGQIEAGQACGMSRFLLLRRIIAPVMLRYALPLVPASIFWWITNASDQFFVAAMLEDGTSWTAVLGASYKLPTILSIVSTIFTEAWQISAFTDGTDSQREQFFSRVFSAYQSLIFLAAAGIVLMAQPFMAIYRDDYFIGWKFIPLLTMATAFASFDNFLNSIYMVEKRSTLSFTTMAVGAGINVALNFTLIPVWGVNGAALATFVSYFVVFLLRAVNTRGLIRVDFAPEKLCCNFGLLVLESALMMWQVKLWPVWCSLVVVLIAAINFRDLWSTVQQLLGRGKKKRA